MPCGCAGAAQRASQRKVTREQVRVAPPVGDSRTVGGENYFWNGPKRASTQNTQHTRRPA